MLRPQMQSLVCALPGAGIVAFAAATRIFVDLCSRVPHSQSRSFRMLRIGSHGGSITISIRVPCPALHRSSPQCGAVLHQPPSPRPASSGRTRRAPLADRHRPFSRRGGVRPSGRGGAAPPQPPPLHARRPPPQWTRGGARALRGGSPAPRVPLRPRGCPRCSRLSRWASGRATEAEEREGGSE
jgi:hypothetical protein